MGAKFEIETVSRQFIPPETTQSLFRHLGFDFSADSVMSIKNWGFQDEQILHTADMAAVSSLVSEGRIVFVYGTINGVDAGFYFSEEEKLFHTGLWFDTALQSKPKMEDEGYTLLRRELNLFIPYDPVCAAIGTEIYLNFYTTEEETRSKSTADLIIWYAAEK